MNRPKILVLAVGFVAVAITAFTIGLCLSSNELQPTDVMASESEKSDEQLDLSRLRAEKLQDRERAAQLIRDERADLVKQLIELAAQKVEPLPSSDPRFIEYPWHGSKHLAILLLGDLRAVEAVPVLLENLEYKNPKSLVVGSYLDEGGWYPAAEALSKIGVPAVGHTIDKLSSYVEDGLGRRLCCWIIKKVLGARLGKIRLQIAIEEARDPTVKKNLTAALAYFKAE